MSSQEQKSPDTPNTTAAREETAYQTFSRYAAAEEEQKAALAQKKRNKRYAVCLGVLAALAAATGGMALRQSGMTRNTLSSGGSSDNVLDQSGDDSIVTELLSETETAPEIETAAETDGVDFAPHAVSSTQPGNLIVSTEMMLNDTSVESGSFTPWYTMDFGQGDTYTDVEGIVTFRGNNFRDNPVYGTADISDHTLTGTWQVSTGALSYNSATWTGNGWTGQPLMQKWPSSVKQHMNMYDWAKDKEDLVEVIYASMDGYVYFLDLETGEKTRDALYLGWTFKGAGALDPRGYPILYVGAGYDSSAGTARVLVVSLLDGSVMYSFGNNDSFSLRGNLSYFDSSPLVDAASDTLIYPGENGIIYLIHLGTTYDESAGTLSLNPDHVLKWRYTGTRTSSASFWPGMEDSAAVYRGFLYIADNGGNLMCLDLNTMELVWVQDVLDDSNSTPVLSIEDGKVYLYVSTSFRKGWRSYSTAVVPIWKIDAETGEIIWQKDYEVYTQDNVSGGVQSTIALGHSSLADNIYVTVSMVGNAWSGVMACIDKKTGTVNWEHNASYSWSSPVCVYNEAGDGEVIYGDFSGNMYVLDGLTGEVYSTVSISTGVIEASPAVYNNHLVVGTRACLIWGMTLG